MLESIFGLLSHVEMDHLFALDRIKVESDIVVKQVNDFNENNDQMINNLKIC